MQATRALRGWENRRDQNCTKDNLVGHQRRLGQERTHHQARAHNEENLKRPLPHNLEEQVAHGHADDAANRHLQRLFHPVPTGHPQNDDRRNRRKERLRVPHHIAGHPVRERRTNGRLDDVDKPRADAVYPREHRAVNHPHRFPR